MMKLYDLYVKNLMLSNAKQWHIQVINYLFYYTVAEKISKVSLVKDVLEDSLIWQEEQNGV